MAVTLTWTFAPWTPFLRKVARRRVTQLDAFWAEGHALLFETIESDSHLTDWEQRRMDWCGHVSAWIGTYVSPVEAARFRDSSYPAAGRPRAFNEDHNDRLARIEVQLDDLIRLRDAETDRLR